MPAFASAPSPSSLEPHLRLRQAVRSNARAEVFRTVQLRAAIQAAMGDVNENWAIARRGGNGDPGATALFQRQLWELEQWLVAIATLDGVAYRAIVEVVQTGDPARIIQIAREIYYGVYDPVVESPEASQKRGPDLTLRWFAESLPTWVSSCEDALRLNGMSAQRWLSSAPAWELNRAPRPPSIRLSLPPDYESIMRDPPILSPVEEEDEGGAVNVSEERAALQGSPGASLGPTSDGPDMMGLVYSLTDPNQVDSVALEPGPTGASRMTGRRRFVRGLLAPVTGIVSSLRGTSNSGSGSSSRRGRPSPPAPAGEVDLAVAFGTPTPSSSSSSRARSPATSKWARGSPSGASPSPKIQHPPPSQTILSSAGLSARPPPSSSAPHQQHGEYHQVLASGEVWTDRLRHQVHREPQERSFSLQGANPIPLVFVANDQSGDTASLALNVGDLVVSNARRRTVLVGDLPDLVAVVATHAGSVMSQRL